MAEATVARRSAGGKGDDKSGPVRDLLGLRAASRRRKNRPRGPLRRLAAKIRIGRVLGLGILVGLIALRVWDPLPLEQARLTVFDLYQRIEPRAAAQQPIVIVDLDEESLEEIGQWPWPRDVIAKMIQNLMAYNAVAVAFDVVFPEPDRVSASRLADSLPDLSDEAREELREQPDNDEILAQVLSESRVVLGQSGYARALQGTERPLKAPPVATIGGNPRPYLFRFDGLVRNLPVLEEAASGLGLFTILPERDGIVRRVPALVTVKDTILPTLSLELLRVATGQSTYAVKVDDAGVQSIVMSGVEIPTDNNGRLWVYFSPLDKSRYISAADVVKGTAPPEALAGNLVFVGTSATGLLDIKTTPVNDAVPGVEIHAQLLEAMLTRSQIERPNYALGAEVVLTAVVGVLIIALVPLLGALWSLLLGFVIAVSLAATSWYLFIEEKVIIDVTFALAASLLLYAFLVYENYFREESQRRQVRGAFGQYLSPALVEQLAADPDKLVLGGETRTMTFLFCDVQGFTAISERYKSDPGGLTRLINRLLTPLSDAILETGGTIDKYMGDCIMAFWNAPLDEPDHARRASEAALDMLRRLEGLNAELQAEAEESGDEQRALKVGIGLNTGECTVGNMGSEQRFDYSVLGDAVNLASRLEGQTRTYGVGVVLGNRTAETVGDQLALLELDLIAVKGKQEPERIFALLGDAALAQDAGFQALRGEQERLLEAYRSQDWAGAREALARCREQAAAAGLDLDTLYALYEERIADYEANPPGPGWTGVYVATSK